MSSRTPKREAKVWWTILALEEKQRLLAQFKPDFDKAAVSRSFEDLNWQQQAQVIDLYRDVHDDV
jgi:hypothetical protein